MKRVGCYNIMDDIGLSCRCSPQQAGSTINKLFTIKAQHTLLRSREEPRLELHSAEYFDNGDSRHQGCLD